MRRLVLLAIAALALPACAQVFNMEQGREPVVSLDGLWRFHPGDNPAWASPTFDDSQWPLLRAGESWTTQGYPDYSGYAWYRFSLVVVDGSRPLALLLPRIYTGYVVYANGRRIGSSGSTVPTLAPRVAANPRLFSVPRQAPGPQTIVIAIRMWEYHPIASWVGGGTLAPGAAAGDPALLAGRLSDLLMEANQQSVNQYATGLLSAIVGLTLVGLFLFRRQDREYLWFAVLLLASAADALLNVIGFSSAEPFLLYRLTDEMLVALGTVAALAFFSLILHQRRSLGWWLVCLCAALSPLSVVPYYFQWAPIGVCYSLQLACLLPAFLWVLASLVAGSIRGDASARLLLLPAALLYGFRILDNLASISFEMNWQRVYPGLYDTLYILRHPFPLFAENLIGDAFVLALLLFLVRRFSLARQEETRLAGEMDAARSVQCLLVPAAAPDTPGFRVDTVYRPASEVGGDFYHVLPAVDGSLLVIVGDVSGKGLHAAMTVSTLMGALRGCSLRSPAAILAYLNGILPDMAGAFVTCLCARIHADGSLILANAGHLPPYCNGDEIQCESGLPLGITPDAAYPESAVALAPGDTLTFLSDGVVEAQDSEGRLFGFERTRAISMRSAEEIARAAQTFGQQDDITVLTLTFAPTEVLRA